MHVKVLIAQTGSIEYVHKDYYERYKDEGVLLIPEDIPKVELEKEPKEEPEVVPEEEPEIEPKEEPEVDTSVELAKIELPKKTRGRRKK